MVPDRKKAGVTLLELLLVLVALAVVASLAIPAWCDGSGRTRENAARLEASWVHRVFGLEDRSKVRGEIRIVERSGARCGAPRCPRLSR